MSASPQPNCADPPFRLTSMVGSEVVNVVGRWLAMTYIVQRKSRTLFHRRARQVHRRTLGPTVKTRSGRRSIDLDLDFATDHPRPLHRQQSTDGLASVRSTRSSPTKASRYTPRPPANSSPDK